MSSKFAKQQKRRKWSDQGLQVPPGYRQQLQATLQSLLATDGAASDAAAQVRLIRHLLHFASIQFTYGELEELKTILTAAEVLAASTQSSCKGWSDCMQLVLELLFMVNSKPLHRQLLAFVKKLPQSHQDAAGQVLQEMVQREAAAVLGKAAEQAQHHPHSQQQQEQQLPQYQQQGDSSALQQPALYGSQPADNPAAVAAIMVPMLPSAAQANNGLNLAQAVVSLLWLPAARVWLQQCSADMLLAVACSVHKTLTAAQQGGHVTPQSMELVQDAISVLYYTLQHHGKHLSLTAGPQGHTAIGAAAGCMLAALQGSVLVREAMASAAVVVWSAAILPNLPPAAAALVFAAGLTPKHLPASVTTAAAARASSGLPGSTASNSSRAHVLLQAYSASSLLEQLLRTQGSSLVSELHKVSPVGVVCALKGLLSAMPAAALMGDLGLPVESPSEQQQPADLQQQHNTEQQQQLPQAAQPAIPAGVQDNSSSSTSTFIMLCALPYAVTAAQESPDAHRKFHAMCVVAVGLQRARALWQEFVQHTPPAASAEKAMAEAATPPAAADANAGAQSAQLAGSLPPSQQSSHCSSTGNDSMTAAAAEASAVAGAKHSDSLVAPWLTGAGLSAIVGLLWGNLDEPMAQTLVKVQDAFDAMLQLLAYQDAAARQLGLVCPKQSTRSSSSSSDKADVVRSNSNSSSSSTGCGKGSVSGFGAWHDTCSFLNAAAAAVLAVPPGRKGRYSPLCSLLPHVGASCLLQLQPQLVSQMLAAMQDDMVANTATACFKALLLQLRREAVTAAGNSALQAGDSSSGQDQQQQPPDLQQQAGMDKQDWLAAHMPDAKLRSWCRWWLPALLDALWGSQDRYRTYVANHALPAVLQQEPTLLRPVVNIILAAHDANIALRMPSCGAAAAGCGQRHQQDVLGSDIVLGGINTIAALVVVLKVARKLQLLGDLDVLLEQQDISTSVQAAAAADTSAAAAVPAVVAGACLQASAGSTATHFPAPAALLLAAVSSSSAALRLETLELACVNARSTEAPGVLELAIAQRWLLLCLRCTGADSRSKCLAIWDKLLTRQRAAIYAIQHRMAASHKPGRAHPGSLPKASANYLKGSNGGTMKPAAVTDAEVLQRQYKFLQWLSQILLDSLYPGGPYERKYFALELLAILLQRWQLNTTNSASSQGTSTASADSSGHAPLCSDLLSSAAVEALLGCLIDSWDKLRTAASRVLELLPSPLPGLQTPEQLHPLLSWGLQLTQSPRIRESDAGARLLRLLFVKYVKGLKWQLRLCPGPSIAVPAAQRICHSGVCVAEGAASGQNGSSDGSNDINTITAFLCSLTNHFRSQLVAAKADMPAASRKGFVHGIILCLRYIVEEVPWAALTSSSSSTVSMTVGAAATQMFNGISTAVSAATDHSISSSQAVACTVSDAGPVRHVLHAWLADVLGLLTEAAHLAQPTLAAQDVNVAADDVEEFEGGVDSDFADDNMDDTNGDSNDQTVVDSSSNANGAIASSSPPHSADGADTYTDITAGLSGPAVQLLTTACWTSVKEVFLLIGTLARQLPLPGSRGSSSNTSSATSVAAVGATGAARVSTQSPVAVPDASDLLQVQQLQQLGDLQLWLLLTMKHNGAVEKSQVGFIALAERLLQSPNPVLNRLPGKWLDRCLERLQEPGQCRDDIVRRSAGLPFAMAALFLAEPSGVPRQLLPSGLQQLLGIAQNSSLPEPWPRVHAFNVLRCVFNDAAMALDSSGYHAAGVAAAIQGMSADAWEVRNAAALTFTALVMRVVGFRNVGTKHQHLRPLQQLAVTPSDLHLQPDTAASSCTDTTANATNLNNMPVSSSASSSSKLAAPKASWCIKSPTASDFFYRYPQLHGFLLGQLQQAAESLNSRRSTAPATAGDHDGDDGPDGIDATANSRQNVPPSLFPVLVILSRLKPALYIKTQQEQAPVDNPISSTPSTAAAEADVTIMAAASQAARALPGVQLRVSPVGPLNAAAFIAAVLAVGRSSDMGVRRMAAAALAPLIPADHLHAICVALAALLPTQPLGAAAGVVDQRLVLNHNALQGTLLQLTAVLAAVANSSSSAAADAASNRSGNWNSSKANKAVAALVADLLPYFVGSSWLMHSTKFSSAGKQAFAAAAGQLLMLAYRQWRVLCSTGGDGSSNSNGSKQPLRLLSELVSTLYDSCENTVKATLPAAAAAKQQRNGAPHIEGARGTPFASTLQLMEALDPQHCCWLRDSTALLLGPLLRLQVFLQQPNQQQQSLQPHHHQQRAQSWQQEHHEPTVCVSISTFVQQTLMLLETQLLSCMASSSYEVRASALKAAAVQLDHVLQLQQLHAITAPAAAAVALKQLSHTLWVHLNGEQTVKVLKRLLVVVDQLQLLCRFWQQQHQAEADIGNNANFRHARTMLAVGKQHRHLEVRMAAVRCGAREVQPVIASCMAPANRTSSSSSTHSNSAAEAVAVQGREQCVQLVQQLLQLLSHCSLYSQPEEIRAAAAEALQLSSLLWPLAKPGSNRSGSSTSCSSHSSNTGAAGAGEVKAHDIASVAVAKLSLAAWGIALRLMEDEEEVVRQTAAAAAQQVVAAVPHAVTGAAKGGTTGPVAVADAVVGCVSGTQPSNSSSGIKCSFGADAAVVETAAAAAVKSVDRVPDAAAAGTGQHVEAVMQSVFKLFASCSQWWPALLPDLVRTLAQHIFDPATAVPGVLVHQCKQQQKAAAAAAAAAGGTEKGGAGDRHAALLGGVLVQRLFEREADNHHEEPLLAAQAAAAALRATLMQQAGNAKGDGTNNGSIVAFETAAEAVGQWSQGLAKFLAGTVASMRAANNSGSLGQWVSGDTSHPEVFVPLYRCLLGLWAAAPLWAGSILASGVNGSTWAEMGAGHVRQHLEVLQQLQPTKLLQPVLDALWVTLGQEGRVGGNVAGVYSRSTKGILFLTQTAYQA